MLIIQPDRKISRPAIWGTIIVSTNLVPDAVRKERAKELLNLGRLDDARALLSELCRPDQGDVEIWFLLSTANGYLGRYEDVITACRQALKVEPAYLPAINNLASALAALGRQEEAAAAFANALQMAPDNPMILCNYGHALALSGRLSEARTALEAAVRIQPHYADAHFNLAVLLDQLGQPVNALNEYEQALTLRPGLANVIGDRLGKLQEIVRGKS